MTQKSLAAQISEMQNNLAALDKLMQAEIDKKFAKEEVAVVATIDRIVVTYTDGTTQQFVPKVEAIQPDTTQHTKPQSHVPYVPGNRKLVVYPGPHDNWSRRITHESRPGLAVVIDGTQYHSIAEASRQLNLNPCTVSRRIYDNAWTTWNLA